MQMSYITETRNRKFPSSQIPAVFANVSILLQTDFRFGPMKVYGNLADIFPIYWAPAVALRLLLTLHLCKAANAENDSLNLLLH